MINAKQVYGTYPHVQMRWHIEQLMGGEPAAKKAQALGRLVTKYIRNCNEQEEDRDHVAADIDQSFTWEDTPEGHNFWSTINRRDVPQVFLDQWLKQPRAKKEIPKAAPKKRVGWWA